MPTLDADRLTAFTRSLVQTRSLTGEEAPVVELVLAEMRALGFDHAGGDGNGSAIGVVEGAQAGPTLLLDAHCDTVGVAPGSTWTRAPFGGQIEDGYLYGRGSADMKGALAAMVHGAATADRSRLAGRVAVSASVMEEGMEGGSLKAVMDDLRPSFVVIGESTELNLNPGGGRPAPARPANTRPPAHSSSPHLGLNAVHAMLPIIQRMEGLPPDSDPLMGPALLALTDIISDPYPAYSVTPSRCRVTYDRRLLPGETPERVLSAIRELRPGNGAEFHAVLAEGEHRASTGTVLRGPKFFPA